ncbi:MAG: ribonuclease HII [Ruminococcaceae bacterium]|nr:ribonuclease HII [Oscillospiraceae bacterium]
MPSYEYENKYYAEGFTCIAGTDEAGRGPLAGPVCAAAVILPVGLEIEGLNDSKKISEKKRDMLFDIICEKAVSYGIAFASVEEIDELNILNASQLAMRRAVSMLTPHPDLVIVDGNIARGFDCKAVTLIKGDAISMSVAAASVLAKVSRDRVCEELDKQYPEYMLAKHKGYSTKLHMDLVRKYGPSPIHRKTFLKFLNK